MVAPKKSGGKQKKKERERQKKAEREQERRDVSTPPIATGLIGVGSCSLVELMCDEGTVQQRAQTFVSHW